MMQAIYEEANVAAEKAFNECTPTPMVVGQATSLFGSGMVAGTEEVVEDGVCGFAWVNISPARGPFITYCKRKKIGRKGVYKGWTISMGVYGNAQNGQSMERKEAAGIAFAKVLNNYGINAYMSSRID